MNIHEYQAKAVLKSFGAPVSRGVPLSGTICFGIAAGTAGICDVVEVGGSDCMLKFRMQVLSASCDAQREWRVL